MNRTGLLTLFVLASAPAFADENAGEGQVRLPLEAYQALIESGRSADANNKPSRYAVGEASVRVDVKEQNGRAYADVRAEMSVKIFDSKWTFVRLLPPGTAVRSAKIAGSDAQLIPTPTGLVWASESSGNHSVTLRYRVDAASSAHGYVVGIPLPRASSNQLTAVIPGANLDASVVPAAGTETKSSGDSTTLKATIPSAEAVQISWSTGGRQGHAISRARYKGSVGKFSATFDAELDAEVFSAETLTLPLLPSSVALSDVQVDGKSATVIVEGNRFATLVKGRGRHKITLGFDVPVQRNAGKPRIQLQIPEIPMSSFEIRLPGKKELEITPAAHVKTKEVGSETIALVNAPMTSNLTMTWAEAVPEEVREEVRANASVYHRVFAEEGVLHGVAVALYEVTRGETNQIELLAPQSAQINRITSGDGSVSDWRVTKGAPDKPNRIAVFLDRKVKGEYTFEVSYETLIGTAEDAAAIEVPIVRVDNVHRQRGMIALLSAKELSLKPMEEVRVNRVGENQLPPGVRDATKLTIAHTYKYVDADPKLVVQPVPPERKHGKFDAQVDTLISLSDVTMKGSATVEIHVKSGKINQLELALPSGVNFLGLTAPSLRTHKLKTEADKQLVDVQFTQDMDGQFRFDVNYERILGDTESEVGVPTLTVNGAEVEQGRIAVEALTAVEVQSTAAEQLSTLDANSLPQQLVLKTTNPILLAYKYVVTDHPARLAIKVTRHKELDVQVATIDRAVYNTLFTKEGLAVTTARFTVRNSRKQFLKVELPPKSKVWSVFVDGKPEKPALDSGDGGGANILIKIVNDTQGFDVELVYATDIPKIGSLGSLSSSLPHPDMVVTHTHWDAFLPAGLSYHSLVSSMDTVIQGRMVSQETMAESVASDGDQVRQPLKIAVPMKGVMYSFEMLYADQSKDSTNFSIAYSSVEGRSLANGLSIVAAVLFWLGLFFIVKKDPRIPMNAAIGTTAVGALLFGITTGYFKASSGPAVTTSFVALLGAAAFFGWQKLGHLIPRVRMGGKAEAEHTPILSSLQKKRPPEPTPPTASEEIAKSGEDAEVQAPSADAPDKPNPPETE